MKLKNCKSLTVVNFSNKLEEIKNQAFYNCESLTEINLPDSVKIIGDGAFENCISVTKIKLSNSIVYIMEKMLWVKSHIHRQIKE